MSKTEIQEDYSSLLAEHFECDHDILCKAEEITLEDLPEKSNVINGKDFNDKFYLAFKCHLRHKEDGEKVYPYLGILWETGDNFEFEGKYVRYDPDTLKPLDVKDEEEEEEDAKASEEDTDNENVCPIHIKDEKTYNLLLANLGKACSEEGMVYKSNTDWIYRIGMPLV